MITDTIASLKQAEKSLLDLLDISGRTGPGMLMDLAEWITNESISTQIGGLQDFYHGEEIYRTAFFKADRARMKLKRWKANTQYESLDWSLEKTASFITEDLEDCIDYIRTAIQFLEEELNYEQQ